MTNQGSIGTTSYPERRGHEYHADAHLLSGVLERPILQTIPEQALLSLRDWRGGHLYQRVQGYDLEGLISFKSGYTRVSGYRSQKKEQAFVTIATSVIEGLNVFDVLTADRVVAQVATSHPEGKDGKPGHVPDVTFLGTQFANLKVSGYDVEVTLNPEVCGDRPANNVPYLFDKDFLSNVRKESDDIVDFSKVPEELKTQSEVFRGEYAEELAEIKRLSDLKGKDDGEEHKISCSLVNEIILPKPIPGVSKVRNVLYVRDFGIVTLGNISVERRYDRDPNDPNAKPLMSNYFVLKMVDFRLGCVGEGRIAAAISIGNGVTKP